MSERRREFTPACHRCGAPVGWTRLIRTWPDVTCEPCALKDVRRPA
jgi:DNA-directed RNA polymerase subunit RPC12/RpoP